MDLALFFMYEMNSESELAIELRRRLDGRISRIADRIRQNWPLRMTESLFSLDEVVS